MKQQEGEGNIVVRLEMWLAAIFLGTAALLVCYSVVLRFIFNTSLLWLIEVIVYLIIASTFIGGSYLLYKNGHIIVELLLIHLSKRNRLILETLAYIMGVVFCIVIAVEGSKIVASNFQLGIVSQTSLRIPAWLPRVVIPLGAVLMTIHFIEKLFQNFRRLRST